MRGAPADGQPPGGRRGASDVRTIASFDYPFLLLFVQNPLTFNI